MTAPQRFRKKPVDIEAMQWDGTDEASQAIRAWAEAPGRDVAIVDTDHIQHLWDYDTGRYVMPSGETILAPYGVRCLIVLTLEGKMVAQPGWWIIRGVQGEFYPCDPDILAETYTAAPAPDPNPVRAAQLRFEAAQVQLLEARQALADARGES